MRLNRVVEAARWIAEERRPYFSVALHSLRVVEVPGLGTFACDRHGRLYVDPGLIIEAGKAPRPQQWSVELAAWMMIHALQHWLLQHYERSDALWRGLEASAVKYAQSAGDVLAESRRQELAEQSFIQYCADLEINGPLVAEGAALPRGCPTPQAAGLPAGKALEWYYANARREQNWRESPACGSAAHGAHCPWEQPPTPHDALSETEADLVRKAVARAVLCCGSVPLLLERWAKAELAPPEIPWERELGTRVSRAVVAASGSDSYAYDRPSRRATQPHIILPRSVRVVPNAAVVIDTSGSMSEECLWRALSEVNGVTRAIGQSELTIICCDAAPAPPQSVRNARDIRLLGGGGTDMGAGIARALQLRPRPGVIVVMTDGSTPWPERAPAGTQVVVCLIGDWPVEPPGWARVLRVKDRGSAQEDDDSDE